MIGMLAEDLAEMGHQVEVIACVPHFPSGWVEKQFQKTFIKSKSENGVNVTRVWVPSGDRRNLIHRQLTFLIYQVEAALGGLRRDYDRVIITNPAIETWLPYWLLSRLKKKPVLYCVWDVYPAIGIKTGIFRHPAVIRVVKWLEDSCLRKAESIHALSQEIASQLVSNHPVHPERIFIRLPWVDTEHIQPRPRASSFFRQHGLEQNFVVLYAGNMGHSQGLSQVLAAAKALSGDPRIKFVFVGDGAEKEHLLKLAARDALGNVLFLPFQPVEVYPEVLASASVSLISLSPGIAEESIPSKTFPALASGRPLLAFVDPGCGVWKLVQDSGAGVAVPSSDVQALVQAVKTLAGSPDLCGQMGEKGRRYAVEHFGRKTAARAFSEQLEAIGDGNG